MESVESIGELSVGNEHIDGQHAQIIYLVKALEEHQHDGPESEKKFFFLLSSLMLTITRHFRDEERLLEKNGCPWLDQQARDHAYFIEKLSGILAMEEREVPDQVVRFMREWLESHLTKLDMKCRAYLEES